MFVNINDQSTDPRRREPGGGGGVTLADVM